jgi:hypothetical protein
VFAAENLDVALHFLESCFNGGFAVCDAMHFVDVVPLITPVNPS